MSTLYLVQLVCEGAQCTSRYPDQPAVYEPRTRTGHGIAGTVELRAEAANAGWETMRHRYGRDLCPSCRIGEIRQLSGGDGARMNDLELDAAMPELAEPEGEGRDV